MTYVLIILASLACMSHAQMVDTLEKRYQETRKGLGIKTPTEVLELFVSDSGTWTIVLTGVKGKSCIVTSGVGWSDTTVPKGQPL